MEALTPENEQQHEFSPAITDAGNKVLEAALELTAAKLDDTDSAEERATIIHTLQEKLEPAGIKIHDAHVESEDERRGVKTGRTREQVLFERSLEKMLPAPRRRRNR